MVRRQARGPAGDGAPAQPPGAAIRLVRAISRFRQFPRGAPATPQQLRHRDSLQEVRRDSMKRSDSVTRASILAGLKVTPEQLLATARSLGRDPMKAQRMSDAIGRKVSALDSASRKAKADSIERAKKAAGITTSAARATTGGAKPKK